MDWIPPFADPVVFTLAPIAIVAGMLMGFAVVAFRVRVCTSLI